MAKTSTLLGIVIGLCWLRHSSSETCDIQQVFKCLIPFNGTYPIIKNISPQRLEKVCRDHGIPTDDCLTNFRFACYPDDRAFVDNVLHALSDMCSKSTLQEYSTYSLCLSTTELQKGLQHCQMTKHNNFNPCRDIEAVVRCERDQVEAVCGAEVGAWYVLWSLQARTTFHGTSTSCDVNLSNEAIPSSYFEKIGGPLAIILIVAGVALLVMALFVCVLYTLTCGRKDFDREETDHMLNSETATPPQRHVLEVY